jgi:hypothetical protein
MPPALAEGILAPDFRKKLRSTVSISAVILAIRQANVAQVLVPAGSTLMSSPVVKFEEASA